MAESGASITLTPDWRQIAEYPDPRSASMNRWATEFLIRNEKFSEAIAGIGKLEGPKNDPDSPFRKRWSAVAREFGIDYPLLPNWGFDSPVRFKRSPIRIGSSPAAEKQHWDVPLLFDLRQSIDKQLATAKIILQAQLDVEKRHGLQLLPRTARNRRPDYRAMLRILDALSAGCRTKDIVSTLFDKKAAPDQFKALRKEAERLRDGGYRYLPILEPIRKVKKPR